MEIIVSPKISRGQGNEVLNALEAAGLTGVLAQKIVDSKENDLAVEMVRLVQNGGFEPGASQKCAREIMGQNYFGIEEAIKHFGVNPSRQQLAALGEVPFSQAVLKACKNTHVLVAVFPLSILDIRGKVNSALFYNQSWYNKETFAKDRGEADWHLIRKTPVENSTSLNWKEQQALLPSDEETPSARVMTYTIVGHFLSTGERLFEHVYVRCSDIDSGGLRGDVGGFNASGLDVNDYWDGCRDVNVGCSSDRKQ